MKKLLFTALIISLLAGLTTSVFGAEELNKTDSWVDVTKAVFANPADKGGWVEDPSGKVFRSEDGTWVKIQHSKFGVYMVHLSESKVYSVEKGVKTLIEGATLIQRDFGTSLVIKATEHKFRVKFKETVAGMKHISGIKGM